MTEPMLETEAFNKTCHKTLGVVHISSDGYGVGQIPMMAPQPCIGTQCMAWVPHEEVKYAEGSKFTVRERGRCGLVHQ